MTFIVSQSLINVTTFERKKNQKDAQKSFAGKDF